MSAWVDVYDVDQLVDGELVRVEVGGTGFVLLQSEDGPRAFLDACPHKGVPLSDGDLDDGVLVCTEHLWEFDACTGEGINPAGEELSACPLRIAGSRIELAPPAL